MSSVVGQIPFTPKEAPPPNQSLVISGMATSRPRVVTSLAMELAVRRWRKRARSSR